LSEQAKRAIAVIIQEAAAEEGDNERLKNALEAELEIVKKQERSLMTVVGALVLGFR